RFERCVVLLPVGGAIARFGLRGMTHRTRLPDPSLRFMQQRPDGIEHAQGFELHGALHNLIKRYQQSF
ncbi:hypothetical protein, partial [Comamonas aquatilis]|uniref:hypothetical protein n=1 Tax=Comamonas aquatilis TaxID=1778406 RepID=UPI0039F00351